MGKKSVTAQDDRKSRYRRRVHHVARLPPQCPVCHQHLLPGRSAEHAACLITLRQRRAP